MGEEFIRELLNLYLHRISLEHNTHSELEFIEIVRNFELVRKKWLQAEVELKKYKELLVKSDVTRAALEVKLKHARNQVDVEIKKRHKAEADYQHLERQMLLMTDILAHDGKSNVGLNDEQRSILASFHHRGANITQHRRQRLSVIDESSFLSHSDISYDRTDDDLDLDGVSVVKPLKSRPREKRRSSMGPVVGLPIQKRGRLSGRSGDLLTSRQAEKEVEATVVTASVTTPDTGGQIHMVIDITQEAPEPIRSRADLLPSVNEQTSVWVSSETTEAEIPSLMEETRVEPTVPQIFTPPVDTNVQHVFLAKTVIRPETCTPCGKRIRFGKMAVKCRDCRAVAHPECKHLCVEKCSSSTHGPVQPNHDTLESFAPSAQLRIPSVITECVKEIERRGLEEKGLYRVPGGERMVKELRERYLTAKGPLMLYKVGEIHVVCGLLKDFLRKLREPLVTFRLHKTFMEAAELEDDDNSSAIMYQAIGELPQLNRETLAFLILHLQRVTQSPKCQMNENNLARIFGPTIVGHGMAEPCPLTIMKDTNTQPKVMLRLFSFPANYWKSLLSSKKEQHSSNTCTQPKRDELISSVIQSSISSTNATTDRDRMFKPLTSPELSKYSRTPGGSSLKGRIKNLGSAFNNPSKPKTEPAKKKFFTSPK
ncbi:rac GTPase-activating protein 1 [Trichomycterus rosablanca]|uniref:rac GTPase-activating protein 1 n=1 Tax=Trichomycterus rosablanca TaxID=2290929 RepID=UPI002F34FAC5